MLKLDLQQILCNIYSSPRPIHSYVLGDHNSFPHLNVSQQPVGGLRTTFGYFELENKYLNKTNILSVL